jgi:DNA-binding CsgD family transcriptional regulator
MRTVKEPVMKSALLLSLLLALIPAAARAEVETFFPAKPGLMLAQLSPEERRVLRERWEQASPEERARIREEFHQRRMADPERMERRRDAMERQRSLTPEEREALRQQRKGRNDGRGHWAEAGESGEDGGFGAGYERRRFLDMPAIPAGDRNDPSARPGMRPGGPDGFMPRPRQP